jgi:hypothetical protein
MIEDLVATIETQGVDCRPRFIGIVVTEECPLKQRRDV